MKNNKKYINEFAFIFLKNSPCHILFESSCGDSITFGEFRKNIILKTKFLLSKIRDPDFLVNSDNNLTNIEWLISAVLVGRNVFIINDKITYPDIENETKNLEPLGLTDLFSKFAFKGNLVLETSGSTGYPKKVIIPFPGLCYQAITISKNIGLNQQDRQLSYMPLNYVYGISILLTSLLCGVCLVFSNETLRKPKAFFDQLINRSITVFSGVPYTYNVFSKYWGVKNLNDSKIRLLTQAGGKLDAEIKHRIFECLNNCEFWIMYGQTEFGGRISQYRYLSYEPNAVGFPIKGTSILIFREKEGLGLEHLIALEGEIGSVYVSSPSMSISHESRIIFYDGIKYMDTGDSGFMKNNKLYIVGRNNSFIKIAGVRINLSDFETAFKSIDNVFEAIVSNIEIPYPAIVVGISLDENINFSSQLELKDFLTTKNTKYKELQKYLPNVPIFVYQIKGPLPILSSGKLNVKFLREKLLEHHERDKNLYFWL